MGNDKIRQDDYAREKRQQDWRKETIRKPFLGTEKGELDWHMPGLGWTGLCLSAASYPNDKNSFFHFL
jgi:hypothetical protein